jgi:hypothetical protein
MKKVIILLSLMIIILLTSVNLNAQSGPTPVAFNVQGGYSWINGVVGAEAQFGHVAISGGWMPARMPVSGDNINSMGAAVTYYSLPANMDGYSYYGSVGFASAGYRYEDSYYYGYTLPVTVVMIGTKYTTGGVNCKAGIGYGWCEEAGAFAFEITLGFTLFGN